MVGRNVVFRFFMDIREFVQKGRQAVKVTNDINQSTQRASGGVRQLESSMASAGRQSAASAVNFQTMTQGMLNLSTAGVQTFTSMSNLDRAGNRLAQSQIAVARAQDLLNNKQLRLNELMEAGGAGTMKATNLTNELATARGDLLVKTDKLKIEEGALRDIQLLFVTNIANVMISSIQTITTLRNADILTTIRQTATNKLLSLGLLTQTKVYQQNGIAIGLNTLKVRTAINVNRLLTLSLPVVGVALVAVTLLWEAYTENLGGFRDMVQETLPFMKDQKQLLRDVQGELINTTSASDDYNSSVSTQNTLLFKLPDNLKVVNRELEKIRLNYEGITKSGGSANQILINTSQLSPPNFRSGVGSSQIGTTQIQTVNGSNVISHEGDARSTANAVNINGLIGFAGGSTNAQFGFNGISRSKEFTNQAGNRVTQDAKGNQVIHGKADTLIKGAVDSTIEAIIGSITTFVSKGVRGAEQFGTVTAPELLRSPEGKFIRRVLGTAVDQLTNRFHGISNTPKTPSSFILSNLFPDELTQRKQAEEAFKNGKPFNPASFSSTRSAIFPFIPNESGTRFTGVGLLDSRTGPFFGTKSVESLLKIPEAERSAEQNKFINLAQNNADFRRALIEQDIILQSPIAIVNDVGGISQEEFFKNVKKEQSDIDIRLFTAIVNSDIAAKKLLPAVNLSGRAGITIKDAQNRLDRLSLFRSVSELGFFTEIGKEPIGLESSKSNFVAKLGSIEGTLSSFIGDIFSLDPESPIVKVFDKLNPEAGGRKPIFLNIPDRVRKARIILEQLKSGDLSSLSDETNHDRLVKAAFGSQHITNFGMGNMSRGMMNDVQGFLGKGLSLNPNDPLLKDTSGFGKNRLEAFNSTWFEIDPETGRKIILKALDIGKIADSISSTQAKQLAKNEQKLAKFANTSGGSAADAIAQAQANRAFEDSLTIKVNPIFAERRIIADANRNKLRNGGSFRPGYNFDDISDPDAVVGGFTSLRAFRADSKERFRQSSNNAIGNLGESFGISVGGGRFGSIAQRQNAINTQAAYSSSILSAGLSLLNMPTAGSMGQNFNYRAWRDARRPGIQAQNRDTLARASSINLLMGGFGLDQYFGSGASSGELQSRIQEQDRLISSIGLNRSNTFNIIDTNGRGREEIDDRLRFHSRLTAMSTGTSPL